MEFFSEKVKSLPPYLFAEFNKRKKELESKGMDIIDLGIGAPDLSPPKFVIEKLIEEAQLSYNHRYSPYQGCVEFREAVAAYYKKRYDVTLDPDTEVLALIGSKEGIAHFVQAVINPGETVLVPNPGYPAYRTSVHLANGICEDLLLDPDCGYIPLFHEVSKEIKQKAKLMFINYPSNPTTASINLSTMMEAVLFARENQILLAHDAAYDMITFGDFRSPSVLQVPGAKELSIEFGSLSKSFNMTGWRIGYAVGNKELIKALSIVKSNLDTSQFLAIQKAAATALQSDLTSVNESREIFEARMIKMHEGLSKLGIQAERSKGTIFLWAKVPSGYSSIEFANKLLNEAGIIVTPGNAFGSRGEGFIRISLSIDIERITEVLKRLSKLNLTEVKDS